MTDTDLLVLGAGAGGLAAAVTAAICGLRVTVLEKSEYLGGTMALSGGGLWLPCNPHMTAADSKEKASLYLRNLLGNRYDEHLVDAFLENAGEMVRFLESNTDVVRFFAADFMPDYEPSVEGANFGRTMSMPHFDADQLGDDFQHLRPPLQQLTAFGGMQIDAADLEQLLGRWRSWRAFRHTTRMVARHTLDWVRSRRGRILKSGNGVAARMIRAARDKGVTFHRNARVLDLIEKDGRIVGARVEIDGRKTQLAARCGVVVATGGFAQNPKLRSRFMPYADQHVSMLPEGNVGDGIRLAEAVGAGLGDALPNNGCWTPVSIRRQRGGKVTAYPHIFLDRSRPGSIIVDRNGKRFVNEATHYQALVSTIHSHGAVPCWLVAGQEFVSKYGIGLVRPYESVAPYVRDGYVATAPDIAELAKRIGVDMANLQKTVAQVEMDAAKGRDSRFGRGDSIYDQIYGEPGRKPNANFAALGSGPYFAVQIVPGDLGTFVGLATDEHACVLCNGKPISGLYAVGLDAQSIMGGAYPGAGSMLGPAFTFGYIAARHAARAGEAA